MSTKLFAFMNAYLKNEEGATAIEYGLIAAGIALAIAAAVVTFGGQLNQLWTDLGTELTNAGVSGGGETSE